MKTIVIIGGGFCGTMCAVRLLANGSETPLNIVLIERRGGNASGVAFSTNSDWHLLNVPSGRMSAFPEDENHFLKFLQKNTRYVTGDSFVPRRHYGEYLEALLRDAMQRMSRHRRFSRISAEVQSLRHDDSLAYEHPSFVLQLDNGMSVKADKVIIAVGNLASKPLSAMTSQWSRAEPRYCSDPWSAETTRRIDMSRPVLLIGTGLTMVDMAVELHNRGHKAGIYALSRRGLLPQAHRYPVTHARPSNLADALLIGHKTARSYLQCARQFMQASDLDWRDVIASIRNVTPQLWQALPQAEKLRFMRHLQPYWDTRRHRYSHLTRMTMDKLQQEKLLSVIAGRITRVQSEADAIVVDYRSRKNADYVSLRVGTIINCTGTAQTPETADDLFMASLIEQRWLHNDACNCGIAIGEHYEVLDVHQNPVAGLFYVGPMLRSKYWEATAIPELRMHVANLVNHLIE